MHKSLSNGTRCQIASVKKFTEREILINLRFLEKRQARGTQIEDVSRETKIGVSENKNMRTRKSVQDLYRILPPIYIYIYIRRPPFRGCHQAAKNRCLPVIYSALVSQL